MTQSLLFSYAMFHFTSFPPIPIFTGRGNAGPSWGGTGGGASITNSPTWQAPALQTVGSSGASTCSASTTTTTTTTTAANTCPMSLPTQRRLLLATMQASQQTRRYLEPHIRQRASLARVLHSIEHSSVSLQRHVVILQEADENENDDTDQVMDICDDEQDQEMLASALSGLAADDNVDVSHHDPDSAIVTMHHHDDEDNNNKDEPMAIMLTTVDEEDELPEPPELTVEDIEATDFSALVRNEPDDDGHLEFYDPMM